MAQTVNRLKLPHTLQSLTNQAGLVRLQEKNLCRGGRCLWFQLPEKGKEVKLKAGLGNLAWLCLPELEKRRKTLGIAPEYCVQQEPLSLLHKNRKRPAR